jgi:hypothetical protein
MVMLGPFNMKRVYSVCERLQQVGFVGQVFSLTETLDDVTTAIGDVSA